MLRAAVPSLFSLVIITTWADFAVEDQHHQARATCASNQLYCRRHCRNNTAELNPAACASRGLSYQCTDNFDQLWAPGLAGDDFWPNCSNSTRVYQPFPPVAQPGGTCSGWQELVYDSSYAHRVAMVVGETYLLWNVVDGELEAKMVHKGRVGWMSIGIENVGGRERGMCGSSVVMGKNWQDGAGPDVHEYRVHSEYTPHHFWSTPLNTTALKDSAMVVTDCFSSIQFTTGTIYGVPLNLTNGSMNRLIWALTYRDHPRRDGGGYAGEHGDAEGRLSNFGKFCGHLRLDLASNYAADANQVRSASARVRPWANVVVSFILGWAGRQYMA